MLKCNILLAAVVAAAPTLLGQAVLTPGQLVYFSKSGTYTCQGSGSQIVSCDVVSGLFNINVPPGTTRLDLSVTVDPKQQSVLIFILYGSTISSDSSGAPIGANYLGYADPGKSYQGAMITNAPAGSVSLEAGTWTVGLYMGLGGFGLPQTLSTSGTILATISSAPGPIITSVVNGASFVGGGVVPGEIATAFGTNLTSASGINLTSSLPLPTTFQDVTVAVDQQAVALFAVDNVNGQEQINFQVPWEVANGLKATIAVTNNGAVSESLSVPVLTAQPGVFNYRAGGNTFGAILHADYQLADTAHPAKAGETVLIYCTGLGAVSSPPEDGAAGNGEPTLLMPTVSIGGTNAIVSFSGIAPGFVGLYQINAEVPPTLTAGNHIVVVEAGGTSSKPVLLPVE